jgi:hypothetical protein
MRGTKASEDAIQNMRKAQAGKKRPWAGQVTREKYSGPNSNLWKGGITPKNAAMRVTAELKSWRTAVYERDDYTCGYCGIRGSALQADHIRPLSLYPELIHDVANGQTLCRPCHTAKTKLDHIWYEGFTTRL